MPGYKALPEHFSGRVAEGVRFAEILQRAGANDDAVQLLEHALELCVASSPQIPGWLCGRLAALYRTLKRYDDEVRLLERYRDSRQASDEAHSRFDARLSKARAIAERKQRTDTRAHDSVRTVIARGTTETSFPIAAADALDAARGGASYFTAEAIQMLRDAFVAASADTEDAQLTRALVRVRDEARIRGHPPERMVTTLREVWRRSAAPPGVDTATWRARYRDALTRLLAMYFDESGA
jgi:hypothetical protein